MLNLTLVFSAHMFSILVAAYLCDRHKIVKNGLNYVWNYFEDVVFVDVVLACSYSHLESLTQVITQK